MNFNTLFLFIALFNSGLGLTNYEENKGQIVNQKELLNKVNLLNEKVAEILEKLDE